jgi:hypothetical protein
VFKELKLLLLIVLNLKIKKSKTLIYLCFNQEILSTNQLINKKKENLFLPCKLIEIKYLKQKKFYLLYLRMFLNFSKSVTVKLKLVEKHLKFHQLTKCSDYARIVDKQLNNYLCLELVLLLQRNLESKFLGRKVLKSSYRPTLI